MSHRIVNALQQPSLRIVDAVGAVLIPCGIVAFAASGQAGKDQQIPLRSHPDNTVRIRTHGRKYNQWSGASSHQRSHADAQKEKDIFHNISLLSICQIPRDTEDCGFINRVCADLQLEGPFIIAQ